MEKELDVVNIKGIPHPIYFRDGTSDASIISVNFCENPENVFPVGAPLECIFDIGGNVGILAVIMANHFPNAKIFSFEPVKENYDILMKNIEHYPNVTGFNFGLGNKTETLSINTSDDPTNHGGFSLHDIGVDTEGRKQDVLIRDINEIVDELGWAPNLIKIDTEGAEHDVLTHISDASLTKLDFIVGELHGVKDFETLNHLRNKGYLLGFNKPMDSRMFMFYARKFS
jgi:FkbM family methyltransferase